MIEIIAFIAGVIMLLYIGYAVSDVSDVSTHNNSGIK